MNIIQRWWGLEEKQLSDYRCNWCEGFGATRIPHTNSKFFMIPCNHCGSTGKVDWVTNVLDNPKMSKLLKDRLKELK